MSLELVEESEHERHARGESIVVLREQMAELLGS